MESDLIIDFKSNEENLAAAFQSAGEAGKHMTMKRCLNSDTLSKDST